MELLINIEDIKTLKDIGKKVDVDKLLPIITQAHDDLRDYLGIDFYFDVLAKREHEDYKALISGSSFTIAGQSPSITYFHHGLKAMLIDLFMARYISQINTNVTPFGATVRKSENSEPLDRATLQDRSKEQLQMAGSKWELIKMYLLENSSTYPIFCVARNPNVARERKMQLRRIA